MRVFSSSCYRGVVKTVSKREHCKVSDILHAFAWHKEPSSIYTSETSIDGVERDGWLTRDLLRPGGRYREERGLKGASSKQVNRQLSLSGSMIGRQPAQVMQTLSLFVRWSPPSCMILQAAKSQMASV